MKSFFYFFFSWSSTSLHPLRIQVYVLSKTLFNWSQSVEKFIIIFRVLTQTQNDFDYYLIFTGALSFRIPCLVIFSAQSILVKCKELLLVLPISYFLQFVSISMFLLSFALICLLNSEGRYILKQIEKDVTVSLKKKMINLRTYLNARLGTKNYSIVQSSKSLSIYFTVIL